MKKKLCAVFILMGTSTALFGAEADVPLYTVSGKKPIGTVHLKDTGFGLLIEPHLQGVKTGLHGFHIHLNPSCDDKGMAAGGHFDPFKSNQHKGPYSDGHLGDLPALYADHKGTVTLPVVAPRLKVKQVYGHSLMLHSGGDNYSDHPQKLGGGGPRLACGVLAKH